VLLIRSPPPRPYRYRRILAGVYQGEYAAGQWDDRDALNHKIVEQAAWLAAAGFAELHVVHVWEAYGEQNLRSGRSPFHFDANTYVESEHERNRKAMNACLSEVRESMASEAPPAFNPVCHMVKGSRRDEIVRLAASLEADLVVVGTAARSGVTALILESAAATVAKVVNCSVLVVKPPGFVTPVVVEEP
jgi:nucleotide-binding universal stress UspA family protein